MSEKSARQIRKGLNEIRRKSYISRREIADECMRELLNAPFKYRFLFAMKVLFRRRKNG